MKIYHFPKEIRHMAELQAINEAAAKVEAAPVVEPIEEPAETSEVKDEKAGSKKKKA